MHLAYLACHGRFALLATDCSQLLQTLDQTEGRLVDDERLVQLCQVLQTGLATFLLRQEPFKIEVVIGQSAVHQCRNKRRGTGQTLYLNIRFRCRTNQEEARITDSRSAGIGDQGNVRTRLQTLHDIRTRLMLVELMMRLQRRVNIVMLQQHATGACVFGKDQINRFEHFNRAERHVLQVADRCRNDIKHLSETSVQSDKELLIRVALRVPTELTNVL